jgi:type III secretion protein J
MPYRLKKAALAAALLPVSVACGGEPLYSELTEQQANEIMVVLDRAGVDARKSVRDENWVVNVPRAEFGSSVELLKAYGYPREKHQSLGDVFKKEGFVSSPLEERARLTYGLGQELSGTLMNIDGVVAARVHLAIPESDPLAEEPPAAAASVFIKHRPGVDLSGDIAAIKGLVVNSVEGLSYERVNVSLFAARQLPYRAIEENSSFDRNTALSAAGGVLLALGGGAAFIGMRRARSAPERSALSAPPPLSMEDDMPGGAAASGEGAVR